MTTLDHQLNRLSKGDYPVSPNFTIHLVPNDQLYLSVTLSRGRLDTNSRSGFAITFREEQSVHETSKKIMGKGIQRDKPRSRSPNINQPKEEMIDTPRKIQDIQNKTHAQLVMVFVGDDSSFSATF